MTVGDREVALSPRAFALLEALLRHPGQVLTRDQLLDHAWPLGMAVTLNSVDAYVSFLRRKLGPEAGPWRDGPRRRVPAADGRMTGGRPATEPVPPNEARLLTRTRWRLVALSAASTLIVLVVLERPLRGRRSSARSRLGGAAPPLCRGHRRDRAAPHEPAADPRRTGGAPVRHPGRGLSLRHHGRARGGRARLPLRRSDVRDDRLRPRCGWLAARDGCPIGAGPDASPLPDRFAARLRGPVPQAVQVAVRDGAATMQETGILGVPVRAYTAPIGGDQAAVVQVVSDRTTELRTPR